MTCYHHHAEGIVAGGTLAFGFHGTGGDERQFVPLLRRLLPGAGIITPRGDVSEFGALRFFRRQGEGVYDMADLRARTRAMGDFLAAEVAAAKPARVVGLGYSNGANILASVLFDRPDLFDDAVVMHPLIPWTPAPAAVRARVLLTAGEHDPICPPENTRALEAWFRRQGTPVQTVWHLGGHEIAPVELAAAAQFLKGADSERKSA